MSADPLSWLYLPSAVVLGALHGLEPGHSKTMMASFIIAIRGTIAQAVLLGVSATISHTALIWVIAGLGLHYSDKINAETTEPILQVVSGFLILGMAFWMFRVTSNRLSGGHRHDHHDEHDHEHGHEPHEHSEVDPALAMALHVHHEHHLHDHAHGAHGRHHHEHDHEHEDAHQRELADQIRRQFGDGQATTGQIISFGLTGGLIPCPAALTVLLLCLQANKFALGFAVVLCFSIGLAITLVSFGAIAAWSVQHATRRFKSFDLWAKRAPYFSSLLLIVLSLFFLVKGFTHLPHQG